MKDFERSVRAQRKKLCLSADNSYIGSMPSSIPQIIRRLEQLLPRDSSRRKVVQILAIVLVVEGLSVVLLFSYAALWIGLVSLIIGVVLLTLLRPEHVETSGESKSPGMRLIDYFVELVGGEYVVMILGAILVTTVLAYNQFVSVRPVLGDVDTISLIFGVALLLHPLLYERFKMEMAFATIFLGTVVIFLVLPQVVQMMSGNSRTSAAGDWYVHYMLAAPFAGILDAIGIQAESIGNMVTIQFRDGSLNTLAISAYCAGLYSFSIFLSAFTAFVLVFESLPKRALAFVLGLGLVIAYVGNLLRMVAIGIVGYYNGIEALHWAHENVGWIIFLAWSACFWWLILGWTAKRSRREMAGTEDD